jgi:FixJ family two-component response regulator
MDSPTPFIAIIDDDASLCTALVGLVRSLGYRGAGYGSAEEFLAAGKSHECAAIVTDIQMPGLSGIELKHRLAQDGCPAPVIMITARTEHGLGDRAFASGAVCVLQKPFAAEALIACLEKALAA